MDNTSSTRAIRLPQEYSSWYGLPIVVNRILNNRIVVYTDESFSDVSNKMRAQLEGDGEVYSHFYSFMRDSAHSTIVGRTGELDLPEYLLEHVGQTNIIDIRRSTFGLEIGSSKSDDLIYR